jgi:transposase
VKTTRAYKLKVYPNYHKLEDMRYTASRYKIYLQMFLMQLYYFSWIRFYSTRGMGGLANQAQKQAMGMIRGEREACKERENHKSSCPEVKFELCPGVIRKSDHSIFDYWITVTSQWKNKVLIPAKSHSKLNDKLRSGWELSSRCDLIKDKNNQWYCRVFVTKTFLKANPVEESLGIDVGIRHGVCRSDNYIGKNLYPILSEERDSQRERSRQGHPKKIFKTKLRQQLDIEVNRALARCRANSLNLVVEHPKVLSNLKHDRWARSYFARQASIRAIEYGVFVQWIHPAFTSITCSCCGFLDKQSRVNRGKFICTSCSQEFHADINAARNIARKGQERIQKRLDSLKAL